MKAPNGIKEIRAFYGNPAIDGRLNQDWERENIVSVKLPFTMFYRADASQPLKPVKSVRLHKKIAEEFLEGMTQTWNYARMLVKQKYGYKQTSGFYDAKTAELLHLLGLDRWGGGFNFRPIRGASKLSMHAYGGGFDVNPDKNPMGGKSTLPAWYVSIWRKIGWKWGNDFARKDPMHWQWGTGY
jgi:hypothetical protein